MKRVVFAMLISAVAMTASIAEARQVGFNGKHKELVQKYCWDKKSYDRSVDIVSCISWNLAAIIGTP